MARVQIRNPSQGRDYYDRKKADGKAPMEAMRCVKRRLSDIVFQQMLNDAMQHSANTLGNGPGRTPGKRLRLQRDRLTSPRRLFGQVTSRTRQDQA